MIEADSSRDSGHSGRTAHAYRARPACRALYEAVEDLYRPEPTGIGPFAAALIAFLTGTAGPPSPVDLERLHALGAGHRPAALVDAVLSTTDLGPRITARSYAMIRADLTELLCVEFDVLAAVADLLADDHGPGGRAVLSGNAAAARTASTLEHYRRAIRQQELVDVRLAQAYRRCAQVLHAAPDENARTRAGAALAQGRLKSAHDQLGLDRVAQQYDGHRVATAAAHYARWAEHAGGLRWAAPYADRSRFELERQTFQRLAEVTRVGAEESRRLGEIRRRGLAAAIGDAREGVAGRVPGPAFSQVDELLAHAERLTVRPREIAGLRPDGGYDPAPAAAPDVASSSDPAATIRAGLDGVAQAGQAVRPGTASSAAPGDVGPPDPVVVSAAARERRHG